ncbi:MAG: hypothetical protein WCT20_00940, partial [Candidatus Babeliales bacterium]
MNIRFIALITLFSGFTIGNANAAALASSNSDNRLTLVAELKHQEGSYITSVAFSPNGELIVTAGSDHTAKIWTKDGVLVHSLDHGHDVNVNSVVFSPDTNFILTACNNGKAYLWGKDGRLCQTLYHGRSCVLNAAFCCKQQDNVDIALTFENIAFEEGQVEIKRWEIMNGNIIGSSEVREPRKFIGGPPSYQSPVRVSPGFTLNYDGYAISGPCLFRRFPYGEEVVIQFRDKDVFFKPYDCYADLRGADSDYYRSSSK